MEDTLFSIKPDAIERGLVIKVLSHLMSLLSRDGAATIVGAKMIPALSSDQLDGIYFKHVGKFYYPRQQKGMIGKPFFALVIRGENAIKRVRDILGPTAPEDCEPHHIRYMSDDNYALAIAGKRMVRNIAHASANAEEAAVEIATLFSPSEILPMPTR